MAELRANISRWEESAEAVPREKDMVKHVDLRKNSGEPFFKYTIKLPGQLRPAETRAAIR